MVIPLGLAALAGCTDTEITAPKVASQPSFAQGDGGVWTVSSLSDPGNGICDDAACTLREAIAAAAAGDKIIFGVQGVIQIDQFTGRLSVNKDLAIDGGGKITLDGKANGGIMSMSGTGGEWATVTVDGLTFYNGYGSTGPGLLVGRAIVTLRNSAFSGNAADGDGGGMHIDEDASVRLINSTVSGNRSGAHGGGIFNDGSLTIINSTIDGNRAPIGGGVYNTGGVVVTGSTISRNEAENAGGLFNLPLASASIARSTISGNRSSGSSNSGLLNRGTMTLASSTITKNSELGLSLVDGDFTIMNSIVAGNGDPDECSLLGGSQSSLGPSLTTVFSSCAFGPAITLIDGSQIFTHVLEPDLKDNGGPTRTHALIARGYAIDAGRCTAETTDQRDFARPVDDPTMPNAFDACDIGAFEAQGPQVAVADLMVSQSVDKSSVKQGEKLTYTVRVRNLGPQAAPNVVLNNVLSSGVTFVEVRVNKGTTTAPALGETGTVTWNLGDMSSQANEVAEIKVTVLARGRATITNTATVSGNVADPNPANNSAAITVTVVPGSVGKKG